MDQPPATSDERPTSGPYDGFPNWDAYQVARARELTRARIRNMRATNSNLSIAQIAGYTGVSTEYVKDVLSLPATFPNSS